MPAADAEQVAAMQKTQRRPLGNDDIPQVRCSFES